jgi:hypothetical protein
VVRHLWLFCSRLCVHCKLTQVSDASVLIWCNVDRARFNFTIALKVTPTAFLDAIYSRGSGSASVCATYHSFFVPDRPQAFWKKALYKYAHISWPTNTVHFITSIMPSSVQVLNMLFQTDNLKFFLSGCSSPWSMSHQWHGATATCNKFYILRTQQF